MQKKTNKKTNKKNKETKFKYIYKYILITKKKSKSPYVLLYKSIWRRNGSLCD